jgi:pteridine reductase
MTKIKVMLITGAARRLGAAMVKFFHQQGYSIILHYRNSKAQAEALAAELNAKRSDSVKLIRADFAKDINYETWLSEAIGNWGCLDVLINNASGFYPSKLGAITAENCYDLFASNAQAPLLLSQAALPYLNKSNGSVVNIIDIHGIKPLKDYIAYSMAKAGLHMLTLALARECAPTVRVNGVAPGSILWPEDSSELSTQQQTKLLSKIPLARQGKVEEIITTVNYLISAEYVTGEIIAVDGGRLLG